MQGDVGVLLELKADGPLGGTDEYTRCISRSTHAYGSARGGGGGPTTCDYEASSVSRRPAVGVQEQVLLFYGFSGFQPARRKRSTVCHAGLRHRPAAAARRGPRRLWYETPCTANPGCLGRCSKACPNIWFSSPYTASSTCAAKIFRRAVRPALGTLGHSDQGRVY